MSRRIAAAGAALVALAVAAPPATSLPRPVPPKDCGFVEVKGKRYQVKGDQLRCKPARKAAKNYLRKGKKPRGYTCTKYPASQTAIAFRCAKRKREILAIRR